ncbi:MAG: polysaccharide biosynthesis tyrosine autokinase [Crocinitomicaceae bacterium]|nr:polysaccharide biosynthesis tyrosine autokinase [Flavobacteriales bacterium]NQZ35014.1 polysaccharide biosynthesis tyrosine autokinase [Crocinitomicaceae bacterium]
MNNPLEEDNISNQTEDSNPRKYTSLALRAWKWYVLSIAICTGIAIAFLRYSTPIYESKATVLVKENAENNFLPSGSIDDIDFSSIGSRAQAEAVVLKSRFIVEDVVKKLGLNIEIISLSGMTRLKEVETYVEPPFTIIEANGFDSLLYASNLEFTIRPLDKENFELKSKNENSVTVNIKDSFVVNNKNLRINPSNNYNKHWEDYKYKVIITSIEEVVTRLRSKISIDEEKSDIGKLIISLEGPTPEKNNNIIDELIFTHQETTIFEQSKLAENRSKFIDERIALLELELGEIESSEESLKRGHDVLDVNIEYSSILLKQNELDKYLINTGVQIGLIKYIEEYINEEGNKLIPVNLGLKSTALVRSITNYNTLFIDYQRLKESTGVKNPELIKAERELLDIKLNLQKSMKSLILSEELRMNELESESLLGQQKIGRLPRFEKDQRMIERHQQTVESLYLFLLQMKEEELILTVIGGNLRVVDSAFCNSVPISPNNRITYMLALILGLFFPTLGLYLNILFSNKVSHLHEFTKYNIPVLNTIPFNKDKNIEPYSRYARSTISESFRKLRLNLNHLMDLESEKCKVLMVTSMSPGEGKTFVSLNLARAIADTNKRTLIIGLDLRVPKLLESIGKSSKVNGVSDYITDKSMKTEDIIIKSDKFEHLHFMPSGMIPPNPSELLSMARLGKLIEEVRKQYDFVIVDACSIGPVVDAYLLVKHMDETLFVCRSGHLLKEQLKTIRAHIVNKKLGKMNVVFNCSKNEIFDYYYYNAPPENDTWFKKIKATIWKGRNQK